MEYVVCTPEEDSLKFFRADVEKRLAANPDLRILEAGTLRWRESRSTHHKDWFPRVKTYEMTDIAPGLDVDFTADLHDISKVTGENVYDAFLACSVWEHLERPWVAAREVSRILKPGGLFFIQTHSTFPLHGFPNDYFRFSTEALRSLFSETCDVVRADYDFPASIVSARDPGIATQVAFLNVNIYGKKKAM
ncbi:MAG TPA: methyltransferase domain-containing protein [Polyangiaceae bacterium]|nr:methyltransferase domain-containing protein [Polyangiaceae bacterium]